MTDWIYDKQNNCLRFGKFCIEPPDEVNPEVWNESCVGMKIVG